MSTVVETSHLLSYRFFDCVQDNISGRKLSYWTQRSEVKYLITRSGRFFTLFRMTNRAQAVILNGTQCSEVSNYAKWEILHFVQNDIPQVSYRTQRSVVKYLITRSERFFTSLTLAPSGVDRWFKMTNRAWVSYWTERSEVKYLITRIDRFFAMLKMTNLSRCRDTARRVREVRMKSISQGDVFSSTPAKQRCFLYRTHVKI